VSGSDEGTALMSPDTQNEPVLRPDRAVTVFDDAGIRPSIPRVIFTSPTAMNSREPGPGVFRFASDGQGTLWCGKDLNFANGLAFSPDGRFLRRREFDRPVSRVPIVEDVQGVRRNDGQSSFLPSFSGRRHMTVSISG
jgi:sugar lactone lactonase YvrE